MSNIANPFTGSQFVWSPNSTPGSKQIADHLQFVSTNASNPPDEETAATLALEDGAATDLVATVQCAGPDDDYFRCDLRGSWFRDDTTVTDQDPPIAFNHAQENHADYDAVLERSGTNILVKTTGPGRWSIAMTRLVSKRDPFDPLSYQTPKVWVRGGDWTPDGGGTNIDDLDNLVTAGTPATVSVPSTHKPGVIASDGDFADLPTLDIASGEGFEVSNHGLTTGPYSVVFVSKGAAYAWMQDANGYHLFGGGGGAGNKLQMTTDAGPYLPSTDDVTNVVGIFIGVVEADNTHRIYANSTTPQTGDGGDIHTLASSVISVGGPAGLGGNGLNGRLRHFLLYSGALTQTECAELIAGFQAEVTP